ncbi:MAG TPA: HDIG domain-containing protein [Bacteroidales bacterium]|jgi:putative nucleotidyltransferase with HDIG domain|nr:HDIG domain-containing protein [Bacteroidales bacterium]
MAESRRPPEIRSDRKYLYHLILFIASIIIVVAISPREGKFRYEYQKGKPWLGSSLIAPRDFPVLKPETEINRERDSILNSFSPYFRLDSQVEKDEIAGFDKYLNDLLEKFESEVHLLDPLGSVSVKRELNSILAEIYQRGVLESVESVFAERAPDEVTIVTGKLAEKRQYNSIFTQKSAYQFAEDKKSEFADKHASGSGKYLGDFISRVAMYDFIKPNLFYDAATSAAIKNRMIEDISLNRGLVQEGELIISRGQIVDDDKFVILESLRSEYEKILGKNDRWFIIFGRFILVTACYLALYLFMFNFRFDILSSTHKTFFIILIILLFLIITRIVVHFPGNVIYLVPFATIAILVRTFYDSRLALFVYLIAIMLAGFIVPNSFEFVFLSYIAGVIVIFSLTNVYRRAKLFFAVFMVFLSYSVVYLGIGLMQEGNLSALNWRNYMWFAGNGVFLLLSYPLIFVFEKTFRFLSDATLLELADTNQPLLRKLAEEAPGSFQHSLQVANLAGEAARKIGANSLLARTGALYHDIGKTSSPEYFVENQDHGFNPHDQLDPLQSASIIISHVKNGADLARKFNLPSPIIDFILTHHGTGVAYFFYKKFLDRNPQKTNLENEFTYPGPKPSTRETAIVMMADAVEAASRTLSAYSEENISELVERIIYIQEQDRQYADTPLTFRDITDIKSVFVKRLSNIYHARISYPGR